MASCDDTQEPEVCGPSAALGGIPTEFIEAGIQLSLQVIADRRGVSKAVVLREVAARLDEPFHSAALGAVRDLRRKRQH